MANQLYFLPEGIEVGIDEAGRGCLAGPVVAAAVVLHPHFSDATIQDSKKLNAPNRERLATLIRANSHYSIGLASPAEIDQLNILRATYLAMHRALDGLGTTFDRIIVDGNKFVKYKNSTYFCIVKADAQFQHVAAASIIAKTFRDNYMQEQHMIYPAYNWLSNKGYPCTEHITSLQEHGLTTLHRKTFCKKFTSALYTPSLFNDRKNI